MKRSLCLVVAVLLGIMSYQLNAQERFIRVTSSGTVQAKPDVATITAYVIGGGDSIEEATADYQTKLTKATEAFDPMEYRDVKVSVGSPSFSLGGAGGLVAMMGGMAGAGDDTPTFATSCSFKVEIPIKPDLTQEKINSIVNHVAVGIEKAELQWNTTTEIPQTNVLELRLTDRTLALNQAMKEAITEARRKAGVIAELNGKKLGDMISVEETTVPTESGDDSSPYSQIMAIYSMMMPGGSSGTDGMIEVTSHLQVTFAIMD